jgi:hypothetical protein
MKQGMKDSHEKGVANRLAPSFAQCIERYTAKLDILPSLKEGDSYEGGYAALSVGSCC